MIEFFGPIGMIFIGAALIFIATNKNISRNIPKGTWFSLMETDETKRDAYEGMQMILFIPGAFSLGLGLVFLAVYFLG